MTAPIPIMCSLDESERSDRAKLIAELGESMLAVEARAPGAVLRFPVERRESVEDFVRSESACCPFFEFDLLERDRVLELRVTAPAAGEFALRGLVAVFAAGWSALV